jgi:peptidoglycan/LPS O-acetylase OafA/YrhL
VLLVVFFHVGYLASGNIGVDIFFALSGYLITNILLNEYADGRWSLKGFYIRRARRLYPALILMLVLTLPFGVLLAASMSRYAASVLIAGSYTSDFIVSHNLNWMGGLLHTWSLAVEEQFYLLWPLVLLFMLKRGFSRRMMCGAIAVTGMLMTAALVANGHDFLPVTRGAGLLFGCLLAVATRTRSIPKPRLTTWVSATLIAAIVVIASGPASARPHLMSAAMGLTAAVAAVLIGGLVGADTLIGRLLSVRPTVWVGERSYGVYLWHFPILYALTNGQWQGHATPRILILTLAASIALAGLSAWLVEARFRVRPAARVPGHAAGAAAGIGFQVASAGAFGRKVSDSPSEVGASHPRSRSAHA